MSVAILMVICDYQVEILLRNLVNSLPPKQTAMLDYQVDRIFLWTNMSF